MLFAQLARIEHLLTSMLEEFSLYYQCFLTLGMSFERWVKVCRPHDSKRILSLRNSMALYFLLTIFAITIPSLSLLDLAINADGVKICFTLNSLVCLEIDINF